MRQTKITVKNSLKESEHKLSETANDMRKAADSLARAHKGGSHKGRARGQRRLVRPSREAMTKVKKSLKELEADAQLLKTLQKQLDDPSYTPQQKLQLVGVFNDVSKRCWKTWDKVRLILLGILAIAGVALAFYTIHQLAEFRAVIDSLALLSDQLRLLAAQTGVTAIKYAGSISCSVLVVALTLTGIGAPAAAAAASICGGLLWTGY